MAGVVSRRRPGALVLQSLEPENDDAPQDRHRLRRRPFPDPAGILPERAVGTPGRPFSIPWWLRIGLGNSSAPARSPGRLVIPRTTSVSTFSPVSRTRSGRNTRAHPGRSEPGYSAGDEVTSIVRVSIQPRPLATSRARSISASRRAVGGERPAGGSAKAAAMSRQRGEAEQGGGRMTLALCPARIVKALKKFHQGGLRIHARVLIKRLSDVIDHAGWI